MRYFIAIDHNLDTGNAIEIVADTTLIKTDNGFVVGALLPGADTKRRWRLNLQQFLVVFYLLNGFIGKLKGGFGLLR